MCGKCWRLLSIWYSSESIRLGLLGFSILSATVSSLNESYAEYVVPTLTFTHTEWALTQ
jgi:hypothetical protein